VATWQDEAHEDCQFSVVAFLEHDDRVGLQIVEVNLLALLNHLIGFLLQKPADMRKKEPSGHRMGIVLRIGELVMQPVIPRPVENGALVGPGIQQHEQHLQRRRGRVALMGPQPVRAAGDAQRVQRVEGHFDGQELGYGKSTRRRCWGLQQRWMRPHRLRTCMNSR
jgi:hypothetical protein